MPELKRNFMQGRMNKDLDERIIPDGEYRDALNVEVSTSEESSVGAVKNIPGNELIGTIRLSDRWWKGNSSAEGDIQGPWKYSQAINGSDFSTIAETVGAVTDPATDKIYSFVSSVIEPYYVQAASGTSFTPTEYTKTSVGSSTQSKEVVVNNVDNLAVGMVVKGTGVEFGTIISSISSLGDPVVHTITLSKLNTIGAGVSLVFSAAALVGCDVDSIMQIEPNSFVATEQSTDTLAVMNDVYNVYRIPRSPITFFNDEFEGRNTTAANKEDKTVIFISESTGGNNPSSDAIVPGVNTGQMNWGNGLAKGSEVEIYFGGINVLTPDVINAFTNKPIGKVKVSSVEFSKVYNTNNPTITVTLNKAIPADIVTQAKIEGGLYFKFKNERLLNFENGVKLNYTEANVEGNTLIENHPTPINTKISGIDIVDSVIYFTDGKTEPKRIDIKKGIEASNFATNYSSVLNFGVEPNYSPLLFETSQIVYEDPISQYFGSHPSSPNYNYGNGQNRKKAKKYELEDITVIRRHPLNPPAIDLKRSSRVGITHEVGLSAGTLISSSTTMGQSIVFTVTKNKKRDYAFPSFYPDASTLDNHDNTRNHSWRVNDVLVLDSLFGYSPSVANPLGDDNGSFSDSGSRMLKVKITAISSSGSFSQPGGSSPLTDYHGTDGALIKSNQRDSEIGLYNFGNSSQNLSSPTYTKYNEILTITAEVVDKNEALSRVNLSATGIKYWEASLEPETAGLFEEKFPRFAIRYKFDDGQYSALSPFSEPCFLPKTTYRWNKEDGQNLAMVNDVRQIVLRDFISPSTPVDVKQIDVLVKFDGENSIYKVESIKKGSREWNNDNGKYAKTILGPRSLVTSGTAAFNMNNSKTQANKYESKSYGRTRGLFEIKTEKIGSVISSNQILRPFDAVPRKAKAQCISANRLIYGNYTLDYDLVTKEGKAVVPKFFYDYKEPTNKWYGSFKETTVDNYNNNRMYGSPARSIKSDRTYTLGVSFLDRFGRQSPVITGPNSSCVSVPTSGRFPNRLNVLMDSSSGIPYWATHFRYYMKETSNEYYNLALFRAYPAEGSGDGEENRTTSYWLAFHSSDRNKVQEGSTLRIKERGGQGAAGGEQVSRTYTITAISNEAPNDNELADGVEIAPSRRKGKFYAKIKADATFVNTLKGGFGANDKFGGVLSDYHDPAIFETIPDPDIGLNIFYEVPRTYPIELTDSNIHDLINFDDFIACNRSGYDADGADSSAPTFRAADGNGTLHSNGGDLNNGTGAFPNELFHLHDGKLNRYWGDLNTRIVAVRGASVEGGIQKIQLDAIRNFGLPVLPNPNNPSQAYIAGSIVGISNTLIADSGGTGPYTGNYNVAGAFATVSHLGLFGTLSIVRHDGTRSVLNINNVNDDIPLSGKIGMGYADASNVTSVFNNNQSYTATNTVELTSNIFSALHVLPFHNCWSFGNGVESDRIRDDFNTPRLDNGVKASSTTETYGEKEYKHGLIFSGIYNAKTDVNNLNQFIKAIGIVKDLNPEYGSIQKLFTRDTNVLAFCENKVLKILSNKDALFNADGNTNVTSNKAVLGSAVPFLGDHGISRNAESFAEDEFRCYFVDRDRGAVCRLSRDGITAISSIGMSDYFSDELRSAVACVGSFNKNKGEYELTIHNNLGVDDVDNDATTDITKRVQTISFNEKTNSWVSFRSYAIEQGVSMNNQYFTLKKGRVWLHSDDATDGRNNFYGTQYFSSITPIFNDAPGSVKSFQTINYEGTQAQVIANSRTATTAGSTTTTTLSITGSKEGLTVGQVVTSNDFTHANQGNPKADRPTVTAISENGQVLTLSSAVTIGAGKTVVFSDAEYYNDDAYTGWYVESINTDQQEGKVLEFKNKEGKWFNYISGVATTFSTDRGGGGSTGNVDAQEFSVQGIGHFHGISGAGNSGLFYSSTVTATITNTCGVSATITDNTESNIPFGTNFGTYTEFDHATGKQRVTICPPTGYSFVSPDNITNTSIAVDSVTLNSTTTQANNIANTFTTTVNQTNVVNGCITVDVNWHDGYTPNANTTLSIAIAANAEGGTIQLYNYLAVANYDLAWEQSSSNEWSLNQPIAIDPNLNASSLQLGGSIFNENFTDFVVSPSENDALSILSGTIDPTTTSQSFSFEYVAEGNTFFNAPTTPGEQATIRRFIIPKEVIGFGGNTTTLAAIPDGFYTSPGASNAAQVGNATYPELVEIYWEFTEYNSVGLATKLKVYCKINHTDSGYVDNQTYGCNTPTNEASFVDSFPLLLWMPAQDIGGGDAPDEPNEPTDIPGDIFDDADPPLVFKNQVIVVHQDADGSPSTGVSVQNSDFETTQFENLNQSVASCFMSAEAGFSFVEANITVVDGNNDNAPSSGEASYVDGAGGDTLTAKIHSIVCKDIVVDGVTLVQVDFTFESLIITSAHIITITIKGDAVNLAAAEVAHVVRVSSVGRLANGLTLDQRIFGNGSSGTLAVTAAPDGNYTASADTQTGDLKTYLHASQATGTSSNGVERTVATVTYKTVSGSRFVSRTPDNNGNKKFLHLCGASYDGTGTDNEKILAWLNAELDNNFFLSSQNNLNQSYQVSFAVSSSGSTGAGNIQETIVATIKFTGTGIADVATAMLFPGGQDGNVVSATPHDNPYYL